MKRFVLILIATLMFVGPPRIAMGQVSQATEAAAKELITVMLREGGQEVASELTELGGQAAVDALLQRAAREGGETLVERVTQYGGHYGPSALKTIELSPSQMVRALDRIPPDLILPAIQAAAREPQLLSQLVSAYGEQVLEVAARQPGVGADLIENLGKDGIRLGNLLTTDQAVMLARHADDIAALPMAQRSQLMDAMMKAPARVLDYLEMHPKVLLTAGGVSAFIAAKDNILGNAIRPIGRQASPQGLVERVITRLGSKFVGPATAGVVAIVVGICAYLIIQLRSVWKLSAVRVERERARDALTTKPASEARQAGSRR